MRLNFEKDIKYLEVNAEDKVIIRDKEINPYSVLTSELGYVYAGLKSDNLNISRKDLEEKFDPVEDFTYVSYSKTIKDFVIYYMVYKSKEKDYFIVVDHDLSRSWESADEEVSEEVMALKSLYYKQDDIEVCQDFVEELKSVCIEHTDSSKKISLVMREGNNTVFKQFPIQPLEIDIDTMYNDDFKSVHKHIVDNLQGGRKGVFLFHGSPGTGKTNYIKNLTKLAPKKKFVFVPVGVIPHLADPSFIGLLIENKGSVLVLEDCENFIQDRGTTGSDVVSTILNLSDGMLSDILGIQIICTFNSDIGKIDEALRRKGRLIDEYEFGKLTIDKAKALGEKLGVKVEEEMTLSEVFNAKDESHRVEVKRKRIGFGS